MEGHDHIAPSMGDLKALLGGGLTELITHKKEEIEAIQEIVKKIMPTISWKLQVI